MAFDSLLQTAQSALTLASVLLNDRVWGTLLGIALTLAVSLLFREEKKLPFLFSALAVALLLGLFFKPFLSQERPCASEPGLIACPDDFALPSLHALLAFTLVVSSLVNRSFPIYFLFSLFVAYSRLYLGVHDLMQVAAGLALAFFACVLAEIAWGAAGWRLPGLILLRHDSVGAAQRARHSQGARARGQRAEGNGGQ